ncbi:MAG: DNA repair protein RadC [Verrucomicrobiota bacterium]
MSGHRSIQDLPDEEKPREKMARLGPSALGDDELLAIFLRTGVKGESAIAIGRRLLNQHDGLLGLAKREIPLLARERGLGLAKACQLAAAFELGSRLARRSISKTPLDSPKAIYDFMAPQMLSLRTESLRALILDSRLQCISIEEISTGSSNETLALARDVLRPVIVQQAAHLAIVHNHPSGNPSPSNSDKTFTRELNTAAELMNITLVDHVIVGHQSDQHEAYFSFRENHQL